MITDIFVLVNSLYSALLTNINFLNLCVCVCVCVEGSSDPFKIDANSGEIRTTRVLSHDYGPSYRMTVIASDQGVPPLQGQAVINIQVIAHITQNGGKCSESFFYFIYKCIK